MPELEAVQVGGTLLHHRHNFHGAPGVENCAACEITRLRAQVTTLVSFSRMEHRVLEAAKALNAAMPSGSLPEHTKDLPLVELLELCKAVVALGEQDE